MAELPTYFFDTSALFKRYHREPGTAAVDTAFATPAIRMASDLALIELASSFARRVRMQDITVEDFQAAKAAIARDANAQAMLRIVPLGEADKAEAARLLEQYGLTQELRTLDALHLAIMRRFGPEALTAVYCADRRLIAILETEGFTVINPETA